MILICVWVYALGTQLLRVNRSIEVEMDRMEPQDLTPMQAAYWVGRESNQSLSGLAAHLYTEFDGVYLDAERLKIALKKLYQMHPMLRVKISEEGQQTIAPLTDQHSLKVNDFRGMNSEEVAINMDEIRTKMTHQKLNLAGGQATDFRLTLLPNNICRFHFDMDMIAGDAQSFRIVIEDLAQLYSDIDSLKVDEQGLFFDYLSLTKLDSNQSNVVTKSREWWRDKLGSIAPAPIFPDVKDKVTVEECHHQRFAAELNKNEHESLQATANKYHLTMTQLSLAIFAQSIAKATQTTQFRLNIPMFFRSNTNMNVTHVVGDFSRLMILSVDIAKDDSLLSLARKLSTQLNELISHSDYPGVNVMRDLSRHHRSLQTSPVVFTSGMNLSGGHLFSKRASDVFGEMVWAISQGSQVTLDAQMVVLDQGVLINWDVRMDVFPDNLISDMFQCFVGQLQNVAADRTILLGQILDNISLCRTDVNSVNLDEFKNRLPARYPLSTLQNAYLLGRNEQMPLGGVAMHDFREFHGMIDTQRLEARLVKLVHHYPLLRMRIDIVALEQYVSDEKVINLEVLDTRHLNSEHALVQAQRMRNEYKQHVYDLNHSPWQIGVVLLPERHDLQTEHIIFSSFDALIADGRAISQILRELFDDVEPKAIQANSTTLISADALTAKQTELSLKRTADEIYWQKKLSAVTEAPVLQWKKPLESVRCSIYQRKSVTISKAQLLQLTKVAAQERLFQNSVLSSLLIEVLSLWSNQPALCIGLPVAIPNPNKALSNDSSFIAVNYQLDASGFINRAKKFQQDVMEGLEHLTFSGVDLNRHLLSKNRCGLALPIVLTNCLNWPLPAENNAIQYVDGVTQTPQVAMDLRLSLDQQKNLQISIDFAEEAVKEGMISTLLDGVKKAIVTICKQKSLAIDKSALIDLMHYKSNGDDANFECSQYLQRIHDNLYGSDNKKVALIHQTQMISYEMLGHIVKNLRQHFELLGLNAGDVVAISLPKSPEHIAITMACALSGLVWVPIDARSPYDRLDYLLRNCKPDLVVVVAPLIVVNPLIRFKTMADLLQPAAAISTLQKRDLTAASQELTASYYLYTSGTTGRPKCVVMNNKATSNVIAQTLKKWHMTCDDVCLSVTPLHHDMSVFDLFGVLTIGATLVIPEADQDKNAIGWNQLVKQYQVTVWCSVPAILEMLLACEMVDNLRSLRLIAQGGDYIKPRTIAYLRTHYPALTLFSLGGPTETTIWSIWHRLEAEDIKVIPYGQPVPAAQYYIVDNNLQHCAAYQVGRIVTSGVCLALGYLEDGELNQNDFIRLNDPQGNSVRAFRTGDQGYYRQDGTIIFSSRIHGYVKVRGVRVSLPDIEKELRKFDSIQDVIIVDYIEATTGDTALSAIYTSVDGKAIFSADIRGFIKGLLPASHWPNQFRQIKSFTLSANGKVDRKQTQIDADNDVGSSQLDRGDKRDIQPLAIVNDLPVKLNFSGDYQAILSIYLSVLSVDGKSEFNAETEFMRLGLLPSHLKKIAKLLNEKYDISLNAMSLVKCKNAQQVKQLIFN